MMEILLNFEKSVDSLAGFGYGETIYKEQVQNFVNWNEDVVIVFPNHISSIAISFVQGFYNEIVAKLGFEGAIQKVKLKAATPELEKKIYRSLLSI